MQSELENRWMWSGWPFLDTGEPTIYVQHASYVGDKLFKAWLEVPIEMRGDFGANARSFYCLSLLFIRQTGEVTFFQQYLRMFYFWVDN